MPAPSFDRYWISAGLMISGALAAAHSASPTGLGGWDAVLRVAFAIVVPFAIGWAPRWMWFAALAVAGGLAAGWPWIVVVGLGMTLALTLELADGDSAAAQVGVGIAAAHGLSNLRPVGPFATTAVVVGVVVTACAVAALARQGPTVRRAVATFGGFAALAVVGFSLLAGVALVRAGGDVERGSAAARSGLDAARDGATDRAATDLGEASRSLAAADSALRAWWVEPGRLVPILGQHLAAARAATGPVVDLVEASRVATDGADIDRLRLVGGAIDLDLVASMAVPLETVRSSMLVASVALRSSDSPWLLPKARDLLERSAAELDDVLPEATKAAEGTRIMPALLGSQGERRYLVMFAMPAESRELGGIMSTYLELTADDGVVSITDRGTAGELNLRAVPGALADPGAYPARFLVNQPERFSTNWTGMTDLPLVAQAASSLYPAFGGRRIDGVVYIDPIGVAALMELSGPIELPAIGAVIDADNVVDFLNVGQYASFDDQTERKEYLTDIAGGTFERLLSGELPSPRTLGSILGPAARGGHLQMATLDGEADDFLASLFLLGRFSRPDDVELVGTDFVSIVQANGEANKIDSFLDRDIDYVVDLDTDSGRLTVSAEVELTNTATLDLPDYIIGTPPEGLPVGTTRVHLSILTPHFLEAATIDGDAELVEPQVELGWQRYLLFVDVPPGERRVARFELTGHVDPDVAYRLTIANQALIEPDHVHVLVRDAVSGETIGEDEFDLVEDTVIEF